MAAAVRPENARVTFADRLIRWQLEHGRHSLPWQGTRDPYAIWISEVMLQQTQVNAVIPYYLRFMARFPDVAALAIVPVEDVLALWSGLGYYSRGRNLHRAACIIMEQYGGIFPRDAAALQQLPGIGRSTAAAIAAFAFGEHCTILDGNVKRILARYFGISEYPGKQVVEEQLWQLAEELLPTMGNHRTIAAYTQALMDLGALVCVRRRPDCYHCPLQADCFACQQNLTANLPVPKPRKTLPVRETIHLILLNQKNQIFLEKRPAEGIWGGLLCFPEIPIDQDGINFCEEHLRVRAITLAHLPHLPHSFTHFKLNIQPLLLRCTGNLPACEKNDEEKNCLWLTIEQALLRGIPVPTRKLLLMTRSYLSPKTHE